MPRSNFYFQSTAEDSIVSAEKDKLLHTLQTVGRLSNKAARRVYTNIVHRLKTLSRENVRLFLDNLVEFLQLARYVSAISDRVFNGNSTKTASCCKRRNSTRRNSSESKCQSDASSSTSTSASRTNGVSTSTNQNSKQTL